MGPRVYNATENLSTKKELLELYDFGQLKIF
jgi:hypothetical protein